MSKTVVVEQIEQKIYFVRGMKVMLDYDLAPLYGIEAKYLKRAVKRNLSRFPRDCVPRTYDEGRCNLPSMVLCKR